MNASALSPASPSRVTATAWMLLLHAGTPSTRRMLIALMLLTGILSVWLGELPPLILPVACLWGLWMPRVAVLHREAWLERLPGLNAAMALVLAATLAPLLHVVHSAGESGWWLLMIAATWLAITFSTWRTCMRLSMAAGCIMLAMVGVANWGSRSLNASIPGAFDALFERIGHAPAWALAACALAAWQWYRLVRRPLPPGTPYMDYPLALNAQAKLWRAVESPSASAGVLHSPGFAAGGKEHLFGPDTPVRAMRAWLGAPFSPMTRFQIASRLAVLGVVWLLLQTPAPRDPVADTWTLALVPLALVVWLQPHLQRIRMLGSTQAGERDELALLPGWRSNDEAHRVFLRALLAKPALDAVTVVAFFAVILSASDGLPQFLPDAVPVIAMTWIALLLGWPLVALMMMTRATWWVSTIGWAMLWANAALCAIWFLGPEASRPPCLVAWIVLLLTMATALWRSHRRFRLRPHPFVSQ